MASYKAFMKSPYKSHKYTTYFEIYDDLFAAFRGKNITFVEIGVLQGGSLFMWREFFGPDARIIGVDLNPNAKKWRAEGFEIFIGSQSDEKFWENFVDEVGKIDIVLDDGGHTYEQQIITTEMLLTNIKDIGLLVVEDTHTSYVDGFGPKKYSFIEYTKRYIDLMNSRFRNLDNEAPGKRVWSIRYYECVVAFVINREATNKPRTPAKNNGKADGAIDYRHVEYRSLKNNNAVRTLIQISKLIPGGSYFVQKMRQLILTRKFKARRFFKSIGRQN